MHKFIYSSSDSFIWNDRDYILKNFCRDELLEIESLNRYVRTFVYTSSAEISSLNQIIGLSVLNFYGYITGSISGSGVVSGSLSGSGMYIEDDGSC